ncbi:hypothetical protein LMTR3_18070 [Bradyrhizobium sp. LMTR 3]|nr:hypothetical protein LMTR3_18070 [Bradyrhizobium sp. LMTR 3]
MLKDRRKRKSVIRVQCLPMARPLSVQSREEFGISRLRRQLFKEYTISCVLKRRLTFGSFRFGVIRIGLTICQPLPVYHFYGHSQNRRACLKGAQKRPFGQLASVANQLNLARLCQT